MYKIIKKSGEVETAITCDNKRDAIEISKVLVERTCLTYLKMGMMIVENDVFHIINGNWVVDHVTGHVTVESKHNNRVRIEFEIITED